MWAQAHLRRGKEKSKGFLWQSRCRSDTAASQSAALLAQPSYKPCHFLNLPLHSNSSASFFLESQWLQYGKHTKMTVFLHLLTLCHCRLCQEQFSLINTAALPRERHFFANFLSSPQGQFWHTSHQGWPLVWHLWALLLSHTQASSLWLLYHRGAGPTRWPQWSCDIKASPGILCCDKPQQDVTSVYWKSRILLFLHQIRN